MKVARRTANTSASAFVAKVPTPLLGFEEENKKILQTFSP
jgi:hypothetical protein